jgi:hypothetical protein
VPKAASEDGGPYGNSLGLNAAAALIAVTNVPAVLR